MTFKNNVQKYEQNTLQLNEQLEHLDQKKISFNVKIRDLKHRAVHRQKQSEMEKKQLEVLIQEQANMEPEREIERQLQEIAKHKNYYNSQRSQFQTKRLELEDTKKETENQVNAIERKLKEFSDLKLMREKNICAKFPDFVNFLNPFCCHL